MSLNPHTGDTIDLVGRNLIAGRIPVDGTTANAAVTYAVTKQSTGALVASGAMAWEAFGYEDCWVASFTAPATPGILVCVMSATVQLAARTVVGQKQISINVIG